MAKSMVIVSPEDRRERRGVLRLQPFCVADFCGESRTLTSDFCRGHRESLGWEQSAVQGLGREIPLRDRWA